MKKTYKFKPGSKVVHNNTKEVRKILAIDPRSDEYMFELVGTRTRERISQEEIESNYEIYRLENIWDTL